MALRSSVRTIRSRVAFALDTCNRKDFAQDATSGGISGEIIRDLMLQCIEQPFGSCRLPHPAQSLSDKGGCYRVRETVDFADRQGLDLCLTPVRSPRSNGMAEAFVKTFKRDYVYTHDRPDAQTVLSQLSAWFEDSNESHPHKVRQMKSRREFIRGYPPATCPV
jgi:putative transposase